MICPRCGEGNPENYHFCGMCGSVLPSGKQETPAEAPRTMAGAVAAAVTMAENARKSSGQPVAVRDPSAAPEMARPASGPTVLGLSQPEPSADSLREKVFAGVDFYIEPERRGPAWGKIIGALVILAALGGAGWWGYTNYLGTGQSGKAESGVATDSSAKPAEAPQDSGAKANSDATTATPAQRSADSGAAQPAAPVENAKSSGGEAPPGPANPAPAKSAEPAQVQPTAKPVLKPAPRTAPKIAAHESPEGSQPAARPAVAKPAGPTEGDALFRKGEAFLYGRGVPENCDEAVKYMKSASAKSSAKARSAFGTMYATGHCVPRDLPSSYRWFALALQADPTNTILEKDLSAVWNQMTPPERQAATKSQ